MNTPFRTFLALFLALLLMGLTPVAMAKKPKKSEPTPAAEPVADVDDNTQDTPKASPKGELPQEEEIFHMLRKLEWHPVPENAVKLGLRDALKQTEKHSVDIAMAREQLEEAQTKHESAETKKLLFFFKFFQADQMENAAEGDMEAATQKVQATINKALLDTSERYYEVMQAVMMRQVAFQSIDQGIKQMDLERHRFVVGENTNFEVLQAKNEVLSRYEGYLKADRGHRLASIALQTTINGKVSELIYPADLHHKDGLMDLERLHVFQGKLTAKKAVDVALKNRPELKELEARQDALKKMLKTSALSLDRAHHHILESSARQLELGREKAEKTIEATTTKAFEDYMHAIDKLGLAEEHLLFADKAVYQVKISQKAGFSSKKDVLDTEVAHAHAQVNYVNGIIDYNLAQIRLLYEMGYLSSENIFDARKNVI